MYRTSFYIIPTIVTRVNRSQHVWFRNQIKITFDKIEWRLWKFMTILPARALGQKPGPDSAIIYGSQ